MREHVRKVPSQDKEFKKKPRVVMNTVFHTRDSTIFSGDSLINGSFLAETMMLRANARCSCAV